MMSNKYPPTPEQEEILKNQKEKAIVSASAGTGKTTTLIEYIANLVKRGTPVSRILAVTFTNNSANEMKERLLAKLMEEECSERILQQIDEVLISDISTIHSFFQKIIKRNIEKLAISQDFFLADSNKSNEIKNKAYIKTYEECCEKEEFENLILSLKKETGLLKEIIFKLEQYFSAQENPKQKLAFYIENQREIFKDAEEYLNESLIKKISRIKNKIESALTEIDTQNKNLQYIENYKKELEKINLNFSLKANIENIFSLEFGRIKDKKSAPSSFLHARDLLEKIKENLKKIPFQEEEFWTPLSFIKSIYDFYNLYIKNLEEIKHNENILDFNDLEKYADELLSQENVAEEIAEEFDYVFIDEYQDTNPVQEKLIKLLSKKAKFMAIGDPKQGIYGFRNATSKIMKKDITEFSKNEGVYYLRKNFRSDSKILDFVNSIFAKVMTKSTTEIDYEGTSMLEGGEFPQTQFPVVRIDLVKKEERQEEMSKLIEYDILADKLEVKDNHKEEVFKLIRNQAQSFDVKYRPIIHIANKRVVTLGYMSFIKPLNSGIFKDYKSFKKAAIKYKKDKDVFSLVNKKIISVFNEEKPNSQTKLLLDIGLELVSVANKNLNLSSLPNDLFILGFEVNDLIDNENNENIINNLKSLKEKGCELALFTSTGDYNLKDRTYRLFDYFFFNSAFENNIKINDPAFIKARMYLGKLSKYNKIIVSYEAPTLFIVEMLVKSGIEYFSCDAIEKKENIPKPIDKKIEKRLLRMYKGD